MKATDLMLGDWVLCDGKPYQIAEISAGLLCIDAERELFANPEDLEPIPLTAEILEKNGFVETDVVVVGTRKMIWESEDGRTEITIWMDDTMPMRIRKNIYYEDEVCYTLPFPCAVHELQHALRLCKIEKEIII